VVVCPACGEENPDRARFCNGCAAPLTTTPTGQEERKVVSVLFVDLVGFTARSEAIDPEDVRATLQPYYTRVKQEIEHYGGTVEKFIGDAVMAVFGAPVAREDDAERAVRAGLRVLSATDELGLEVRAAINTGEAVVALNARPEQGESLVAGDVVNTASRLQGAAATGALVVGDMTYRTTVDVIEYEQLEPVVLKGKAEPIPLWRALRPRSSFGVDAEIGAPTPFVGRDHELSLLKETYAGVVSESAVQLVTLVGEPGVGKTRLLRELGRWLDAQPDLVSWRQGRCLPYGEGITFWALGEIVKAHAGVLETDGPEVAMEKLATAVRAVVPDASEQEWIAARLGPLAGIGGDGSASRDESFTAWRQFLEALAAERPLVLLFEDIHWADAPLLEFLEHLVDWSLGVPLLVLCTARPELYELHRSWGGGKRNSTTVSLSALSGEDTSRLLAALLSEALLPAETQALLLERCGGNPLYAEQFVRMLNDRGILERRGRVLRIAEGKEVPVPETVQALIAARLDTLGPARKAVLQDAAVVGKVFWARGVASLGAHDENDVVTTLVDLAHNDFVRAARESSFAGQREFVFTHLLLRDVAYRQIPRAERARKHRQVAEWIEETVGERVEDHGELLAFHYGEALQLARAAGAPADELEPLRAATVRFLGLAGDRARELDFAAASRLYERALTLAAPGERAVLLLAAGRVASYGGQAEQAHGYLQEAVDAFRAAGDAIRLGSALAALSRAQWVLGLPSTESRQEAIAVLETQPPSRELAEALGGRAGSLMMSEEAEACLEVCERALPIAVDTAAAGAEADLLQYRGISRLTTGDVGGIDDCEAALRLALDHSLSTLAGSAYVNVSYWRWWLDGPAAGADRFREGIEFCSSHGVVAHARWTEAELLWALFELGDWDDLVGRGERLIAEEHERPIKSMVVPSLARVLLARGSVGQARSLIEPLLRQIAEARVPQMVVPALTVAAAAAVADGEHAGAAELLAELEELTRDRSRSRAAEIAEGARVAVAARDTRAVERILADSHPPVARAEHQVVSARAVLAEAAGDNEAALALYRDAVGRWDRFGHVVERAHALLGAGRCATALGLDGAAETAEARAQFDALGAVLPFGDIEAPEAVRPVR